MSRSNPRDSHRAFAESLGEGEKQLKSVEIVIMSQVRKVWTKTTLIVIVFLSVRDSIYIATGEVNSLLVAAIKYNHKGIESGEHATCSYQHIIVPICVVLKSKISKSHLRRLSQFCYKSW